MPMATFSPRVHGWLLSNLMCPKMSRSFPPRLLSSQSATNHLLTPEVIPDFIQDHFLFLVFDGIPVGHKIYLACRNPSDSTCVWCISLSCFCTACRLALCVLYATIQIIMDAQQHWIQYQRLGCISRDWPPPGFCASDHNTLRPLGQLVSVHPSALITSPHLISLSVMMQW